MDGRLALLAIKPQPAVVSYLNFCLVCMHQACLGYCHAKGLASIFPCLK